MTSAFLDLFKKDELGNPIWIGAVRDISTARRRLLELVILFPGEYEEALEAMGVVVWPMVYFEADDALASTRGCPFAFAGVGAFL